MSRATVIYFALAVLLAHTLAIHKTPESEFSPPFEAAHVAYRQGRNLVHRETISWNPGEGVEQSYPSLPWVGLAWAAERVRLGPNKVAQVTGTLAALATVIVMSGFTRSRIAGLIATGLLAASGAVAAAAGSGTEYTTTMLLVATTVFAFERGSRWLLAAAAAALVLVRPEGVALVALLLTLDLLARPKSAEGRSRTPALAVGLVAWLVLCAVRWAWFGTPTSAYWRAASSVDGERLRLGLEYVWSFLVASGAAPLVVFPLALLVTGRQTPMGKRALILFAGWTALVVWTGGNHLPFWMAMVPAIPLLFLSIQCSVANLIDTRPRWSPVMWVLLSAGVLASFLVSKVPGNLGPLPLESLQERWTTPRERLGRDYPLPLGRPGLMLESKQAERLRCLGVFLRDRTIESATVHTLWPGAIGYMSRRRVVDLLGRAWPSPGQSTTRSWSGSPKVDLLAALTGDPDYLVLFIDGFADGARPLEFLRATLDRYDVEGGTPARMLQVLNLLSRYELVCVPVPERSKYPAESSLFPFPLLRARRLGMTPELSWQVRDGEATLFSSHVGHELVVDLRVRHVDAAGEVRYVTPDGHLRGNLRHARTDLLLFESGERPIELFSMPVPEGTGRLEATLVNPGAGSDTTLVALGEEAVVAF